jgi:cytochrome c oxidase cbb3-type subunit 3
MAEYKADQERGHSYDGITEYDNKLPNWWLMTLYATIVFAVGYWLFFHTLGIGGLPIADYENEMEAAAEAQLARMEATEITDESLELMSTIGSRVEQGSQLYQQYCVVCHGLRGEGAVGPNLTDRYWIHGGRPIDIHRIVTNGVPDKGMVAWGRQLGPARVQAIVAHVLTLRNTEVPGKEPEGEPYEPAAETGDAAVENGEPAAETGDAAGTPTGAE